jgi:hypothetical protein
LEDEFIKQRMSRPGRRNANGQEYYKGEKIAKGEA